MMTSLESRIEALIQPINGQYPRPWMSNSSQPEASRIFLVGFNQATTFPQSSIGEPAAFLDALFNRKGRSIRALYDETRPGARPSPTRRNIDALTAKLTARGITDILETNVVCYSSAMGNDLRRAEHAGGVPRGQEIFRTLLDTVRPSVLLMHGEETRRRLARILDHELVEVPSSPGERPRSSLIETELGNQPYVVRVFVVPSLAPPGWNRWSKWAESHLDIVCDEVRAALA
jgi:hypothetical protein